MASKKPCRYGGNCYRKNPQHLRDYSHPNDSPESDEEANNPKRKRANDVIDSEENETKKTKGVDSPKDNDLEEGVFLRRHRRAPMKAVVMPMKKKKLIQIKLIKTSHPPIMSEITLSKSISWKCLKIFTNFGSFAKS